VRQVDRVAHALARIQFLGTAFHVSAAALQEQDLGSVANQLAGDTDPRRPCSHDADISINLLIAGERPGIRQHPSLTLYVLYSTIRETVYSTVLAQAYDAAMLPISASRDHDTVLSGPGLL
jgi:hypothetical protein